jgi:hypothetical protein
MIYSQLSEILIFFCEQQYVGFSKIFTNQHYLLEVTLFVHSQFLLNYFPPRADLQTLR